jgi:hypothetical protein
MKIVYEGHCDRLNSETPPLHDLAHTTASLITALCVGGLFQATRKAATRTWKSRAAMLHVATEKRRRDSEMWELHGTGQKRSPIGGFSQLDKTSRGGGRIRLNHEYYDLLSLKSHSIFRRNSRARRIAKPPISRGRSREESDFKRSEEVGQEVGWDTPRLTS